MTFYNNFIDHLNAQYQTSGPKYCILANDRRILSTYRKDRTMVYVSNRSHMFSLPIHVN